MKFNYWALARTLRRVILCQALAVVNCHRVDSSRFTAS